MANIWHDKRTFGDENKFVSAKVQQTHPRVHSVKKKQVFGELKNVMHNQFGVTPLKGGWDSKNTNSKSATKCNEAAAFAVSNKKPLCIPIETSNYKLPLIDPVELFDLFDFPKACCTKNCHKSDVEIWADEYNQIDEIALLKVMEKIRNGSGIQQSDDEKSVSDDAAEEYNEREDAELDNLLAKSGKRTLYLEERTNDDFTSCCSAEMPKLDVLFDIPLLNAN